MELLILVLLEIRVVSRRKIVISSTIKTDRVYYKKKNYQYTRGAITDITGKFYFTWSNIRSQFIIRYLKRSNVTKEYNSRCLELIKKVDL